MTFQDLVTMGLGPTSWFPDLSLTSQAFVRSGYGVLLLGTLALSLGHGRRFFVSERWKGYALSAFGTDLVLNPSVYRFIMLAWIGTGVFLVLGIGSVWAALLNLVLCYFHFIAMRWRTVLRGMGAPGFMTYWLAAAVFLLELTNRYAPQARSLAVLVLQVDYALIMFSAGVYKWTAGYAVNEGMEYGMVNPQWGYWHLLWRRVAPDRVIFRIMNHLGWSVEVLSALLMLVPQTRFLGALMIILSFVFIATQIRLCLLTQMVILGGVLFFGRGTIGQRMVDSFAGYLAAAPVAAEAVSPWLNRTIQAGLWVYLVLLPAAHAGLFFNFYKGKRLLRPLQNFLEAYTNVFGLIIWRVFSADHTNFFVRIWRERRDGSGTRALLSDYDRIGSRFNHVGESITVTSIFTSLKYYPSNSAIFRERLVRYARTLPCPLDSVLVFEYVSIRKLLQGFTDVPVAEFLVDPGAGTVLEKPLEQDTSCLRLGRSGSPVREGTRPGSYAA